MEILVKNLLEFRNTRTLSRQTVADAIQICAKSYERYEKGEREPAAPVLVALADYFNVTTDSLRGRSDRR